MASQMGWSGIWKEARWYGVFGLFQLAVDSAVFLALSNAGMGVAAANLIARTMGAAVGFFANGRVTFAGVETPPLHGRPLGRFAIMWTTLTLLGTAMVWAVREQWGLKHAWFAKPLIDVCLAMVQFILSRNWVYR